MRANHNFLNLFNANLNNRVASTTNIRNKTKSSHWILSSTLHCYWNFNLTYGDLCWKNFCQKQTFFYYYIKALSYRKVAILLAALSFVIVTICPSRWRTILQATHSVQQIAECHVKDFMTRLCGKNINYANTCCYCLQQGCHLLPYDEWANVCLHL